MAINKIQMIRGNLLKCGHTYASIAKDMQPPVSRQHVRDVVCGRAVSARVQTAIAEKLGYNPWHDHAEAS